METVRRTRRPRNRGKLIAAGFAAALVIGTLFWWNSAQEMPVVTIPKPVMPNSNAFDTFNSAAALNLDANKVGYAISAKHTSGAKDDHEYTWAEKQKFLAENAPALALLRQGLGQEYLNPPMRSINALSPYYAKDRAMARLLALESLVKAHKGDYSGAVGSGMDAMELGEEAPHGSVLIGGLVGIACTAIGRRPLWQYVDKLNAEEARAAVRRMERIRAKEFPFSGTMQEEKWAFHAVLLEAMRSPNDLGAVAQTMGTPASSFANSPLVSQLFYMIYSKRRIMNDYTSYMDAEIARAKLPYGSVKPTPIPNDPICQILLPIFDQASLKFVVKEANNAMIEIAFALRAYRLQNGRYPDRLDELTPSLLPRPLADPFAKGGSFHYRRAANSYALYSVGPDGKDDGGKPIDSGTFRAGTPNERYFVQANSTGDIVAGKNIW